MSKLLRFKGPAKAFEYYYGEKGGDSWRHISDDDGNSSKLVPQSEVPQISDLAKAIQRDTESPTSSTPSGGNYILGGRIDASITNVEVELEGQTGEAIVKPPESEIRPSGEITGSFKVEIAHLSDNKYNDTYPRKEGMFRCAWLLRIWGYVYVNYRGNFYRCRINNKWKHRDRIWIWQKNTGCIYNSSTDALHSGAPSDGLCRPTWYKNWKTIKNNSAYQNAGWNGDLDSDGKPQLKTVNYPIDPGSKGDPRASVCKNASTWGQSKGDTHSINCKVPKKCVSAIYSKHAGETTPTKDKCTVYFVLCLKGYSNIYHMSNDTFKKDIIGGAYRSCKFSIKLTHLSTPEIKEWTETKEEKKIVVIHYNIAQSPNTPPADTTSLITTTTTVQHRTIDGEEDDDYPITTFTKVVQPHTLTSEIPQYPFHQIYHIQSFDQNGNQISSSANGRVDNWLSESGVPTYTLNVTRTFEFVMWLDESNKDANWTYSVVKRGPGQSAQMYPGRVLQPNEVEQLIDSGFFTETSPGTYNGQQYDTVYEATLYACWSTVYIDWLPKESDLNLTDGYRLDPTSPWTYTPDYDLQIASETDSVPEQASQVDLYANFIYRLRLFANGGQFTDCYDASYTINGSTTTVSDDPHYWEQSNGIDPYKKEIWLRRYVPYQLTDKVVHLTSTFLGWNTNKDATSPSYYFNQSVTMPPPIDLYAVWQLKEFNVYFRTGYGNNDLIRTVRVKYGAGVPVNQIPVYGQGNFYRRSDSYVFTGWSGTFLHVCSDIVVEGLWAWSPIWVMQDGRWIPYRPHDSNLLQ